MPAFNKITDLYSYFRSKALKLKCNPCFDDKQAEIEAMNEKGTNGTPGCLCVVKFVACPCKGAAVQIKENGECHCEIFRVILK